MRRINPFLFVLILFAAGFAAAFFVFVGFVCALAKPVPMTSTAMAHHQNRPVVFIWRSSGENATPGASRLNEPRHTEERSGGPNGTRTRAAASGGSGAARPPLKEASRVRTRRTSETRW